MKYECFDTQSGKELAKELLRIEAIKLHPFEPFTWASGWKSPIYCDNRLSLSHPRIRSYVKNALVNLVSEKYPKAEAIAGVATAGIPQGVLIADTLGLPFIYVRSKSKGHGLSNQIEGAIVPEQKVVVVEDLVSTGGSSLAAVDALRSAKIEVLGMVSIFTYGFEQAELNFKNKNVNLYYLSEYSLLIESALESGFIKPETKEMLDQWRKDPSNWKY